MFGELLVNVVLAAFLAFIVERVIEWLVAEPLEHYFPDLDRFFLRYVAFAGGAGLSWVVALNIFAELPIPSLVGKILTAILIGCGLEVLHEVVNGSFE